MADHKSKWVDWGDDDLASVSNQVIRKLEKALTMIPALGGEGLVDPTVTPLEVGDEVLLDGRQAQSSYIYRGILRNVDISGLASVEITKVEPLGDDGDMTHLIMSEDFRTPSFEVGMIARFPISALQKAEG